jgi:hypothetical protein
MVSKAALLPIALEKKFMKSPLEGLRLVRVIALVYMHTYFKNAIYKIF